MPDPSLLAQPKKPNTGQKIKVYKSTDVVASIRGTFSELFEQGYTHVVNMPGDIEEILCVAKYYNMVCLHRKNLKYIADYCSRRTPLQDLYAVNME